MSTTTKTNSTTNQSQTQTPTNPSWVQAPLQNLTSQITALGAVPASTYVAPENASQTAALSGASALANSTNPNFTSASGILKGA